MSARARVGLDRVNPIVAMVYAILAMFCVMVAFNPICAMIALLSTASLGFLMDGWRNAAKRLSWQISLIAVFASLNCIFAQRGETVFFSIGPLELHFESFIYGACIGVMIVSVMNCFLLLSEVVSSDDAMILLGGKMPVIALVTSMSIRLVPRFRKQAKELGDIRNACTCARPFGDRLNRLDTSDRLTHLLAASLEDSLVRADSMRSRGWGAKARRTVYGNIKMGPLDVIMLLAIIVIGILCFVSGCAASFDFQFYPYISFGEGVVPTSISPFEKLISMLSPYSYLLYATFFFLPFCALFVEVSKWKR